MQNNQAKLTSGRCRPRPPLTGGSSPARCWRSHPDLLPARPDGNIWAFVIRIVPADKRDRARRRVYGFHPLIEGVRATFVVAPSTRVGIAPGDREAVRWLPLALLVNQGAFILPAVGAVVSALAVVVALLTKLVSSTPRSRSLADHRGAADRGARAAAAGDGPCGVDPSGWPWRFRYAVGGNLAGTVGALLANLLISSFPTARSAAPDHELPAVERKRYEEADGPVIEATADQPGVAAGRLVRGGPRDGADPGADTAALLALRSAECLAGSRHGR